MAKIIKKWWFLGVTVILVGIYVYGYRKMFFHQDDLDWFIMMNRPFWAVMAAPLSDHINYLFRILFEAEWDTFHLNFPAYLAVSVGLHALSVWFLYKLAKVTSGRSDLAAAVALIFSVNTNWTEIVLWTSGQTVSITAVFVLFAMLAVWQKKRAVFSIWLATLTSGLALGLLPATLLVYGVNYGRKRLRKIGFAMILIMIFVLVMYKWRATDGTQIEASWRWVLQVAEVVILAPLHTVLGRLLIPFDRWEMGRIVIVILLMVYSSWRWRDKLGRIWRDRWSRFLILQGFFYYLIVAVGRAQYGVGIMRAERYSYLGLALFLLLLARVLRKWQMGKWIWAVPVLLFVQCVGLYTRAQAYVVRPQQLKKLFVQVYSTPVNQIDGNAYLPHFVFNGEHLRYSDLTNLMNN